MKPIMVTIHVNAAAAVRCGSGRAGAVRLDLGDEDVRALTQQQRNTLANHLNRTKAPWGNKGPQWSEPLAWKAEPVAEANFAVLQLLLDRRAKVMAEYAEYFEPPTNAKIEDVLMDLAKHMPHADVAGHSWDVVQAALIFAAERCEDLSNIDPPDPRLVADDPPWASW